MKNARILTACGITLIIAIAVITFQSITSAAVDMNELKSISISLSGGRTIETGESVRLTAEGDYGTQTVQIKARWSITQGQELGKVEGCEDSKICTFTAGDEEGMATVQAQIDGSSFTDTVDITIEKPEEVLQNPFSDFVPEWALGAVVEMNKIGIIRGYNDGRFGAGDPVTNGQVAVLLKRILTHANLIEEPKNCENSNQFSDVSNGHYAFASACLFKNQGWSDAKGNFEPDVPAPRGRTARFISRVLKQTILKGKSNRVQHFDDVAMSDEFYDDTATVNALGIMTGNPNGNFGARDPLNRAEAAVVMKRVLDKISGVTTLVGYDSNASASYSAASTQIGSAACVVQGENGGVTPLRDDSDMADAYAKENIDEELDLAGVRSRCTDTGYQKLMDRYCVYGSNQGRRVQWGVILYDADGKITLGGGAASGSNYHVCPEEEVQVSSVPQNRGGSCFVFNNSAEPLQDDPLLGTDYAKQHFPGADSIQALRSQCTQGIVDELVESYCNQENRAEDYVEVAVATYNDDGSVDKSGCWPWSCELIICP